MIRIKIKLNGTELTKSEIYKFNCVPQKGSMVQLNDNEIYKVIEIIYFPTNCSFDVCLIVE